jgi:hypothetical protein
LLSFSIDAVLDLNIMFCWGKTLFIYLIIHIFALVEQVENVNTDSATTEKNETEKQGMEAAAAQTTGKPKPPPPPNHAPRDASTELNIPSNLFQLQDEETEEIDVRSCFSVECFSLQHA